MPAPASRGYRKLMGAVLLIAGTLLGIWLAQAFLLGQATYAWPQTTGLIYESNVNRTTLNPGTRQGFFSAEVRYRYVVLNTRFENNQIFETMIPLASESDIKGLLAQFPVGTVHPVYYDPDAPDTAVLERGVHVSVILCLAPTLLFLLIGLQALRTPNSHA